MRCSTTIEIFTPGKGPKATTVEAPAPSWMSPFGGVTLTPGPEADQLVVPVIAEPLFVIVNST